MDSRIKFYGIVGPSGEEKAFAWAMSYGLLPSGMPFLHPAELEREIAFQRVNPAPPGLKIEGGRLWPDFLGHGGGSPSFFVSERVVHEFHENNLPIARITEMPIAEVKSKSLSAKIPPRYFVVESVPGIELDFAATGIRTDANGNAIMRPLPNPWPPLVFWARASSWNGSDLFRYSNFGNPFKLIITQKIVDLGKKHKWLNFVTSPIWAK